MHPLRIKGQIGRDAAAFVDSNVAEFVRFLHILNHPLYDEINLNQNIIESKFLISSHLFQVSLRGAEENDCIVACGTNCNGRQQDPINRDDGTLNDGLTTPQWSVHVQATKVFANSLESL